MLHLVSQEKHGHLSQNANAVLQDFSIIFVLLHDLNDGLSFWREILTAWFLVTQCFPYTEGLYMLYRNYEVDPVFGGTAKCVWGHAVGDFVNDSMHIVVEYGNETV